jgi:hypothetical protein
MLGNFLRIISLVLACFTAIVSSASAAGRPAVQQLREEIWALMTPLPLFAYDANKGSGEDEAEAISATIIGFCIKKLSFGYRLTKYNGRPIDD